MFINMNYSIDENYLIIRLFARDNEGYCDHDHIQIPLVELARAFANMKVSDDE